MSERRSWTGVVDVPGVLVSTRMRDGTDPVTKVQGWRTGWDRPGVYITKSGGSIPF